MKLHASDIDNRNPFMWRAFFFVHNMEAGLFLPRGWNLNGLVIQSVSTGKSQVISYSAMNKIQITF